MTQPTAFGRPCPDCANGGHDRCRSSLCGCLADHPGDETYMANFKRLKRQLHPEREAWVKGGWSRAPIRVTAEVGHPDKGDAE